MADKKPVMDVAKPGDTPAGATSRPIILSKKPAVKDPMVTETEAKETQSEAPLLSPSVSKKKIEPISSPNVPKEIDKTADEDTEAKPTEKPDTGLSSPSTDELVGEGQKPEDVAKNKADKEAETRQDLTNKLIAEKKYFVPIGAAQHKRSSLTAVILALLLLVVVGGVIAVDAELISVNIELPFDLIK